MIHDFDFATTTDRAVPVGAPGDSDNLSDVSGNRIAFSRTRAADSQTAVMVFDTATGAIRELDPQPLKVRFGAVVGGDTVAYGVVAFETSPVSDGVADVFVYVLATTTLYRVTDTPTVNETLNEVSVLPSGAVRVVWAGTEPSPSTDHDIYARTFSVALTLDADGDGLPDASDNCPLVSRTRARRTGTATRSAMPAIRSTAAHRSSSSPTSTPRCARSVSTRELRTACS